MTQPPRPTTGLRHVALNVTNYDHALSFYVDVLGMEMVWQPDSDSVFLTSGNDILTLRRRSAAKPGSNGGERLDHIGFIIDSPEEVDRWHDFMKSKNVTIERPPSNHRDGSRSFFVRDPDETLIQMIYYPPLA